MITMVFGYVCLPWFDIVTLTLFLSKLVVVRLLSGGAGGGAGNSGKLPKYGSVQQQSVANVSRPEAEHFVDSIASGGAVLAGSAKTVTGTWPRSVGMKIGANGSKVEKQKSLQSDDISTYSRVSTLTLPSSMSMNSLNGCIPQFTSTNTSPPPPPPPSTSTSSSSSLASMSSLPSNTFFVSAPQTASTGKHILCPSLSIADNISDEYQEDEDTLSLENLFPCDQSEIYASKKISFIIDELIQTEWNYVNNIRKGLCNYGSLHKRSDLPDSLLGKDRRMELLGNIEEILDLHEREILPMMLRNQRDLKLLFDEFAAYFNKNRFYCYAIYAMNEKTSMSLRRENREWFQRLQCEINDRLGIDSFLVQPIQRLTRYPLLLQQFISEFYKSGISCKPVLASVCKLETRMRRWLEVVNQAQEVSDIEDVVEPTLLTRGQFRRATEFEAYHHRTRKRYRAKIFLFEHCLLCAEIRKKRLVYRIHYDWHLVELQTNHLRSVTLLLKPAGAGVSPPSSPTAIPTTSTASTTSSVDGSINSNTNSTTTATANTNTVPSSPIIIFKEELELIATEAATMKNWLISVHTIVAEARRNAALRGKFSLPMDLVMGVALAIWLIWVYL